MPAPLRPPVYPFAALVGQAALKEALLLAAIDPRIGGVMLMGQRGSGKSTAVRALAELLPEIETIDGCPFRCAPGETLGLCAACTAPATPASRLASVPVVDLPLGATEDRVAGSLDLEAALVLKQKRFEPGLLARAHRGFLYIDEANLLEDHLVDLLLDVAAAGFNVVEREGISIGHPARFVLIGSANPEEGELRPQLLDRFGLFVGTTAEADPAARAEIVRRRLAYDDDPAGFRARFAAETARLREVIALARDSIGRIELDDRELDRIAAINADLELDGHRGELVLARAARARAAMFGREAATAADIRAAAPLALGHRLRRDPLDEANGSTRIEEALDRRLGKGA